jgi:LacI family transcriptional regulator
VTPSEADLPESTALGPLVTIRDVALRAGVSVGTVSNVLNRPNVVAPDTLAKVQSAIASLGFVRHAGAALMRGGRARTIGLVVLDVTNPFFTELARGAENAAREHNHLVILCNSDEDAEQERRYLEVLEEQRVLGVLISPVAVDGAQLDRIRQRGTAVVLLEHARPTYCSVRADDAAGGRLAALHLLDLGHERLLYVSASPRITQYSQRLLGVRQALAERGRPASTLDVIEVGAIGTMKDGSVAATQMIERGLRSTGIICGNDLIALGFIGHMRRARVNVPADISVVGYDDIELAEQNSLPLTTVRQPKQNMGRTAAKLLIDEAEQGTQHTHQQIVFQPELIVRKTTGPVTTQAAIDTGSGI